MKHSRVKNLLLGTAAMIQAMAPTIYFLMAATAGSTIMLPAEPAHAEAQIGPDAGPLAPTVCATLTFPVTTTTNNAAVPPGVGSCGVVTFLNDGTNEVYVTIGNVNVTSAVPAVGVVNQTISIPPGQSVPIWVKGAYFAAVTATGATNLQVITANGTTPYTGGAGTGGGGSGGTVIATQPLGSQLHVDCDAGCSSSPAPMDNSAFTFNVSSQTPVGAVYSATSQALAPGSMGVLAATQFRALKTSPTDAFGNALGTPTNPLQVSLQYTSNNPNSLTVVANAGLQLNTSLLALESGGNIANISSAVASSVMQENIKQIGAVPVLAGAGATGTGSQRVTVAIDTSTIAGAAVGTAGSSSTNVVSMQGIGGGTAVGVSGTVTAVQPTGTNLHFVCDSGCSSSTAPADASTFTPGTTSQSPIGGFYQTTATNNPLTNLQMGTPQLTATRALFMNPRNSSGVEIGTASTPIQVSIANTAVNATSINAALTGTLPAFAAVPSFALNTTPSLANGNGVVPTQGGTALSATNGGYGNVLQGNAVLSATNGLYTNLLQGNAVVASGNPIFASITNTPTVIATQPTGSLLHTSCDSGCSSSTSPADNSGFTPGTTSQTPVGGFYQTTFTSNPLTAGNMGAVQLTQFRSVTVNLRTAAGAEIGIAAAPVQVSLANNATNATAVNVAITGTLPAFAATPTVNIGTTANLALETGGNLANISAAVVSSVMQSNLKQIGATTVLAGAGATGTGSQRVTIATDASTIAGSAVGTAGTASSNVVSVQGIAGGVAQPVSGSVSITGTPAVTISGTLPGFASVPAFSISGLLPAYAATPAFTISGTLPAFATTPTFNVGTPGSLATAANQNVTVAGTTATSAQGVQGVTGGIALPVSLATLPALVAGSANIGKVNNLGNAGGIFDFAGTAVTAPANSLQVGGTYNSATLSLTNGQAVPLQTDPAGNLKVNVVIGGGSGSNVNLFQVGTVATAIAGSATGIQKVGIVGGGGVAMDFNATTFAAAPTNALQVGGQYLSSAPTLTTGQAVPLLTDVNGNLLVNVKTGGTIVQNSTAASAQGSLVMAVGSSNINAIIQADHSVPINISTATTTQLVALASGAKIYVTGLDVVANGTGNIQFEYGTGTACATGTTILTGNYNLTAQAGLAKGGGLGPMLVVPASNALCVVTSAAIGYAGSVSFTQSVYGP